MTWGAARGYQLRQAIKNTSAKSDSGRKEDDGH